ncbi:hypothetical protein R5R35_007124 [Gryllus longicercus]|uniref:Ribosomal protein eL8/eL30/eS12/Gadd45 domain-containing protein n=1 Tax=Gryllus longicercus TaxID=2509291 RepID=A0AAN9Z6E1_9ORTH
MAYLNNDYPELYKNNCWNNAEKRTQSQPRSWPLPTNSNASYSKVAISGTRSRTTNVTGRTKQWRTLEASIHFSDHKEFNSYDNKNLEVNISNNNQSLRTLQNRYQSLTNVSEPSSRSGLQKSINNELATDQSVNNFQDTTNHTTATTSDTANDVTFEANLEEKRRLRRERQKVKREMKKQEKAIQREEEMRKKRLGPKDQKITIIDHSVLDRFLVKESTPVNIEVRSNLYSGSEFPTLGEVTSAASKSSSIRNQKRKGSKKETGNFGNIASAPEVLSEPPVELKTSTAQINRDLSIDSKRSSSEVATVAPRKKSQENQGNKETNCADDSKKATKVDDKSAGKRPKRRDPIQLDINEMLKVQETKVEVSVKQHPSKPVQKVETARYAGNILDSDNPERKRGKQREVPKAKKPTPLKQIILKEREKRKESHLQKAFNTSSKVDVKDENKGENLSSSENSSNDEVSEVKPILSDSCNVNISKTQEAVKSEHKLMELDRISTGVEETECKQNLMEEKECKEMENKTLVEKNEEVIRMEERRKLMLLLNGQADDSLRKNETKISTPKIHSRKFRDYCDHFITPDILSAATSLLEDIVKFHDRQFAHSPLKASAKRRHVTGLKEVHKFLALRRVRLLVIAPDLEPTTSSGGLDDLVDKLKGLAVANEVPYVFTLSRRHLGYILKKKVPVSCVGVLNYDGTEHNFRNLMTAVEKARQDYKHRIEQLRPVSPASSNETSQIEETPSSEGDVNKEVVASLLAKLAGPPSNVKSTGNSSPFLQAIEQRANMDSYSDEDQNEE